MLVSPHPEVPEIPPETRRALKLAPLKHQRPSSGFSPEFRLRESRIRRQLRDVYIATPSQGVTIYATLQLAMDNRGEGH